MLKTPLSFLLALDKPSIRDLHETRQLIEVHLAGCAAERRTEEDLRAMEGPLEELRSGMKARRGYIDPDCRFQVINKSPGRRVMRLASNKYPGTVRRPKHKLGGERGVRREATPASGIADVDDK